MKNGKNRYIRRICVSTCQWFLLFFFTTIFLLSGCTFGEVKVGLMVDLSDRSAELGVSARNGALIAAEEINAKNGINGKKLELLLKNDEGTAEGAIKVDEELIKEKIVLGIGHLTSGPGVKGFEVFQKSGIPMLSPLMSTNQLTGKNDEFYRIIAPCSQQGEIIAKDASQQSDKRYKLTKDSSSEMKNAAVLMESNNFAFSNDVGKSFVEEYEKKGGSIVYYETFTSNEQIDFNGITKKIKESEAETVLIVAGGMDVGIFTQKIRASIPNCFIYSSTWGMTKDMIANAGASGEGVRFASLFDPDSERLEWVKFKNKYIEAYGEQPGFASMYAYEAVYVASEAMKRAKSIKFEDLEESLVNNSPYRGLQGMIKIDSFGDSNREYIILQVSNGKFGAIK